MNNEQRGVALLIVLMLLALMAALAADMTISFTASFIEPAVNHHLQRQYDIELAEKLALASLHLDVKDNDRQNHVAAVLGTTATVAAGKWQYSEVAVTRCPALF